MSSIDLDILPALLKKFSGKIIIDGALVSPKTEKSFSIINPATGDVIGTAPLCDTDDVNAAVQSSKIAYVDWTATCMQERAKLLRACGSILTKHSEELARLMTLETGKAIRTESRLELSILADTFDYYAGLGPEIKGETIPFDPDMLTFTLREPLGVVGVITPWNVPLMLLALKIAPALIAGNAVVIKPSPEATLTTLYAVDLINTVLPKGLCNVVTGDGEMTGEALVVHPDIAKVSFTGSVESGKKVSQKAADKLIPVTLELGGKSPLIIMEDADIDGCVDTAFTGMRFTRQGQSCTASSRLFVHRRLYKTFLEAFKKKLDQIKIGDPTLEETDAGTLISKRQYDTVNSFLDIAKQDPTLEVHACSRLPDDPHLQKGYFVRPTIITGVKNDHILCQKEIFGPVVCMMAFDDFDEVIDAANHTHFGLAAGIYTKDLTKALQFVHRIEAGFVHVNQYTVVRPMLPFGGYKQSGLGKEACLETITKHYMREKTVMMNIKL